MTKTLKSAFSAFVVAALLSVAVMVAPALQSSAYAEDTYTGKVTFALTGTDTWTTTYVGRAWQPDVTLTVTNATTGETKQLYASDGYKVTYSNNTDAGTGKVYCELTSALKSKYPGLENTFADFTIKPASLYSIYYKGWRPYTGAAQTPLPTTIKRVKVAANGETAPVAVKAVKGKDYTISYSHNKVPGYATVKVTGKGNYTGTVTGKFGISRARIATLKITLSPTSYVYNGLEKTPKVTIKNNGITLKKGTNYKLTYKKNKNIGQAKVKINGVGKYYKGQKTLTFTILPKSVSLTKVQSVPAGVSLAWTSSPKVDGYQIYRCIPGETKWHRVKTTSKTSYVDKSLKIGVTYRYKVRAYKSTSSGTYYSAFSAYKTVLNTKINFKLLSVVQASNSLKATWSALDDVDSYTLYRCKEGTGTWTSIYTGKSTTYTDSNVAVGFTYDYKVVAKSDGVTMTTNTIRAHLANTSSFNLAVQKYNAEGYPGFKATWKAMDDDDSYELVWSQSTDFSNVHYWHTDNTYFTLNKPNYTKAGQTWYVKVRSYHYYNGKVSYSGWSNVSKVVL